MLEQHRLRLYKDLRRRGLGEGPGEVNGDARRPNSVVQCMMLGWDGLHRGAARRVETRQVRVK